MGEVIIVTGIAGAGRTTALRALEDLGWEAVDNLPPSLLSTVIAARDRADEPLAVGIDTRTRNFRPETFLQAIDGVAANQGVRPLILYLECDDDVLMQRFAETRRRHPMADRPVVDAIGREREMMAPVRARADVCFDTTRLTAQDLRRAVHQRFAADALDKMRIEVVSFSYRVGVPREADLVIDVRFLRNPHWEPKLQPLTGLDPDVQRFIREDPRFDTFVSRLQALLELLVPAYRDEGKSYLTLAFGCTGGKHRSVFVAELVTDWLASRDFIAALRHREQGRYQPPAADPPRPEPVS